MAGGAVVFLLMFFFWWFLFPAAVSCELLAGAGDGAISASPSSPPTVFTVGGEERGWRLPAPQDETYNHWAARNRFHVGDFLYFRYAKNDSVLVVARDAYKLCSAAGAAVRLEGDGEARFRLERSGSLFFISGAPGHCRAGQRMAVRVMALRDKQDDGAAAAAPAEAPAPGDGDDEDGSGGSFVNPGYGSGLTPGSSGAGSGSVTLPRGKAGDGKTSGAGASSMRSSLGGGYHVVAGAVLGAAMLVILA